MRNRAAALYLLSLVTTACLADDGDWTMPAKDHASTRYSPLAEINATNVGTLTPKVTFSTGVLRGHEGAPIVVGGTMYVVTPFPNVVFALDLAQPGAPVKWKFEPKPAPKSQGVACCDHVNRGAVYADGKLFLNTLDNQTIALDAQSGKELWRVQTGDIGKGETLTMAPLVVNDRVLVGNSGGEFGVRGWLAALDVQSGKEIWRAYSTGPDREVLIGPSFKPFYATDRGQDLGVSTWPSEAWKTGGGTVWGWISYDAEQNLIYYGTANPGPWNPAQRPGDNKWTSGVFARDARTGEARWFYQMSPHDLYDYDGVNENILIEGTIDGRQRKVLVHPDRNGYLYVIDRSTGEVISATPFAPITTSTGVDLKTGRIRYVAEKEPVPGKVVRNICPAAPGAKDWQPSAYSPRTGLVYIPHQNLCLERRTGDRRRSRVLRNHGRLVQSGRREDRIAGLAIQDRFRHCWSARFVSGAGRTSVHRDPVRCRRLGGCGRRRRSRYARCDGRERFRECITRSQAPHDQRRNAVCVRAAVARS